MIGGIHPPLLPFPPREEKVRKPGAKNGDFLSQNLRKQGQVLSLP